MHKAVSNPLHTALNGKSMLLLLSTSNLTSEVYFVKLNIKLTAIHIVRNVAIKTLEKYLLKYLKLISKL
jgi:hypothetical protein